MTVKELIEKLKVLPENNTVFMGTETGYTAVTQVITESELVIIDGDY